MPNIYCVRANYGQYAQNFLAGGYAAIGWLYNQDLSDLTTKEQLYPIYKAVHPEDTSNIVIGQQVGQIARFLFEIKAGDYIILPSADTDWLHWGIVEPDPSYSYFTGDDGCPYRQRRKVAWSQTKLQRGGLSIPLQNTLGSSLTVFAVSQHEEFFAAIGKAGLVPKPTHAASYDPHAAVLERILELDPTEFEVLVTHLLAAIGFEGAEHTGKPGDGGVDATGELNVAGLAKIKLYVQAKRYQKQTISHNEVKKLRQSIPFGGQGAFITTSNFDNKASSVALEPGFPRIGLVNGHQLVDLLVEHWDDIPEDFQQRLGLQRGLVRL